MKVREAVHKLSHLLIRNVDKIILFPNRIMENNSPSKAFDITEPFDVTPIPSFMYFHKVGYLSITTTLNPFLSSISQPLRWWGMH